MYTLKFNLMRRICSTFTNLTPDSISRFELLLLIHNNKYSILFIDISCISYVSTSSNFPQTHENPQWNNHSFLQLSKSSNSQSCKDQTTFICLRTPCSISPPPSSALEMYSVSVASFDDAYIYNTGKRKKRGGVGGRRGDK